MDEINLSRSHATNQVVQEPLSSNRISIHRFLMNRASQKRNQTAWLRRNGVTACPPWSLPRFFSYPALSHYYVWISQRKAAWPSHDNAERGSTGISECNAACNAGDAALRRGISRNATGSAMREVDDDKSRSRWANPLCNVSEILSRDSHVRLRRIPPISLTVKIQRANYRRSLHTDADACVTCVFARGFHDNRNTATLWSLISDRILYFSGISMNHTSSA